MTQRLRTTTDFVASLQRLLAAGTMDEDTAIRGIESVGGRFRFVGGTNEVRLAGIAGTGTSSKAAAIASWLRASRRKLERSGS